MPTPIGDEYGLEALGLGLPQTNSADEAGKLGQEEFLTLMITQLKNQDPTKPLESGEFLGQLAQFGTVSGLADLQGSFDSLASSLVSNQALQAAGLVGRSVLARSSQGFYVPGQNMTGAIDLPIGSGNVRLQIRDAANQLIRDIDLGAQSSGRVEFSWNGQTDLGIAAPGGRYRIEAQYFDGAQMQNAQTLINSTVESVSLNPFGLGIELLGLGEIAFNQVQEIG
ncbi:MAG: flagellar hook assembly protein FlgD [Gammaproteobacteria bacterium]|nr:flagellar hook assembly protein FlgD [Gammaproteobacteria bacterium]